MAQALKIAPRVTTLKSITQKARDLAAKATEIGDQLSSSNVEDKKLAKKIASQANKFSAQLNKAAQVSF